MYGGEVIDIILLCKKDFYPYVYDKFRYADRVEDKNSSVIVKINKFADGFIKWILSQLAELVQVIEPEQINL